jgi:hypothetical protein
MYHCEYVAAWIAVKQRWGLLMDAKEKAISFKLQSKCID